MLGSALRLVQYLGNPSLWGDELSLVRNVSERGLPGLLFQALDGDQVAPVGYLLLTKTVMVLFGESELALRLAPFSASVLALVLFWPLARGLLGPGGALLATAAFATNPLLISLSALAKQYATDVLAGVLVLMAFRYLWEVKGSGRSRILVGACAGALGFLSIPSVMISGAAIIVLVGAWATGAHTGLERRFSALAPLVVWVTLAGIAALWARLLVAPETREYMVGYWDGLNAFAPPFAEYPTWGLDQWRATILSGFLFRPYIGGLPGVLESIGLAPLEAGVLVSAAIFATVVVTAIFALLRVGGVGWSGAVVLPFVLAWSLSRLELYPFNARTSVILVPLVLLLVGALVAWIVHSLPASKRRFAWAIHAPLLLMFLAILVDRPPVYRVTHEREVILELSGRRSPGEPVFVTRSTARAIAYYGDRFGVDEGVSVGVDLPADLATLFGFRGEPSLWVVFSNAETRDFLLCYLDEIGRETERFVIPSPVLVGRPTSLHRYDLSDETRWISPEASDFPTTEAAFEGGSPRCSRQS